MAQTFSEISGIPFIRYAQAQKIGKPNIIRSLEHTRSDVPQTVIIQDPHRQD